MVDLKTGKWLFLSLMIFIFFASSIKAADVIIRKDGRRIEGNIVNLSPEQIAMEVGGVIIYINHDDVLEIITEKKPDLVREAETALNNDDYEVALSKAVEILLQIPEHSEKAKPIFFTALKKLQGTAADYLKKENYDSAIRLYLFLLGKLEKEAVAGNFFGDYNSWNVYIKDIKNNLAQTYLQRGLKFAKSQQRTLYPVAKKDLETALTYLQRGSADFYEAKLTLGRLYFELEEYEQAKSYLELVLKESTLMEQKEQSSLLLTQVASKLMQPAVRPSPTPVRLTIPTPLPAAVPATQQPAPISYQDIPKWKRILMKNASARKVFNVLQEIPRLIVEGEYFSFLFYPLIIIIFWSASYQYLKFKARRGDLIAASVLRQGKLLGPIAVIYYQIKHIKLGGPKKRCPFCGKGIDDIDAYTDLNFYVCPHCQENITPVFDLTDYVEHLVKSVEKSLHSKSKKSGIAADGLPIEKDAMLKLVRSLVTYAVRRRASDIHIEQEVDRVKVRARIDGLLFDIFSFPKSIANAIISAIKVMANLDIAEKRIPQDGQFTLWIDKSDIDIRVATSPAAMGEKASMRMLDIRNIMVDSTKLGLEGENLEKFERAIRKPYGLVLVTGPSGSGKTTTLYVALNSINTGEKNIITIEDPIEYHIKGLNQLQVNPVANFTFATGLRSIIRQDPDVIMVGEIRDRETADIAVEAALTGHLVFSTLHTIDAPGAFGRLIDLGTDPKRFVPALICIIAQRLVRINCPECKKPLKPKKSDLDALGISAEEAKQITFMKGTGCPHCFNSGFWGRIGLFEIFMPDESMKEILETNVSTAVIRELARKSGMRTLREEGILKVKQGLTTVEEVIRVTS